VKGMRIRIKGKIPSPDDTPGFSLQKWHNRSGSPSPLPSIIVEDQVVLVLETVSFDASIYSLDPDSMTFEWEQTSGTSVTLDDSTAESPSFTAPGTSETLVFTVTASDSYGQTVTTVTIEVEETEPL